MAIELYIILVIYEYLSYAYEGNNANAELEERSPMNDEQDNGSEEEKLGSFGS